MAPTYVPILRQPFWHRRYVAWMQRSEIQESATWLTYPRISLRYIRATCSGLYDPRTLYSDKSA